MKNIYVKKEGITLIALIITIIIMLILVGVTINVALSGGLLDKAEKAAEETEKEGIYEQIVGVMILTDNGKIEVKQTYDAIKEVISEQGRTITLVSPSSEDEIITAVTFDVSGKSKKYTYTITTEKIMYGNEIESEDTIETIWAQRGITSPNVKLDVLYYNANIKYSQDDEITGLTFGLISNGDVCVNYNADIIALPNLGTGGLPSENVQTYIDNGYVFVGEDKVCFIVGDFWITLKYTQENKVEMYVGQQTNLVDGFVPQTDEYYKGELLPQ